MITEATEALNKIFAPVSFWIVLIFCYKLVALYKI